MPFVGEGHFHLALLIAIYAGPMLGVIATAAFVDNGDEEFDRAIKDRIVSALLTAKITNKEACALMGYDQSQWSKILRGDLHTPSFTRMRKLPLAFWLHFVPELMLCVTMYKMRDLVQDRRQQMDRRKAS